MCVRAALYDRCNVCQHTFVLGAGSDRGMTHVLTSPCECFVCLAASQLKETLSLRKFSVFISITFRSDVTAKLMFIVGKQILRIQ